MSFLAHLSIDSLLLCKYNNISFSNYCQQVYADYTTLSVIGKKAYELIVFHIMILKDCYISQKSVADKLGVTREWINKLIKKLVEAKLLIKEYRHRWTCIYKLPDYFKYIEWNQVLTDSVEVFANIKKVLEKQLNFKEFTPLRYLYYISNFQERGDIRSWGYEYLKNMKFEKISSHLEASYHQASKILWSEEDDSQSLDETTDLKNKIDYRNSRMLQSIMQEFNLSPDEMERVKDYSSAVIQYVWNSWHRCKDSVRFPKRWLFYSLAAKKEEKYWSKPSIPTPPKKIFSNEEPYEHLTFSEIRSNFMYKSEFPKQRVVEFLESLLFKEMPSRKQYQYIEEMKKRIIN